MLDISEYSEWMSPSGDTPSVINTSHLLKETYHFSNQELEEAQGMWTDMLLVTSPNQGGNIIRLKRPAGFLAAPWNVSLPSIFVITRLITFPGTLLFGFYLELRQGQRVSIFLVISVLMSLKCRTFFWPSEFTLIIIIINLRLMLPSGQGGGSWVASERCNRPTRTVTLRAFLQ